MRHIGLGIRLGWIVMLFCLNLGQPAEAATPEDLVEAVGKGDLQKVRTLVRTDKISPNTRDGQGYPVLAWAALRGYADIAEELLQRGADANIRDHATGATPLMHAVSFPQSDPRIIQVMDVLLLHGGNVNATDTAGYNALMRAAQYNTDAQLVQALLARGADVNAMTSTGWTPLHLAISSGKVENARMLAQSGADLSRRDPMARLTPAQRALQLGHTDLAADLSARFLGLRPQSVPALPTPTGIGDGGVRTAQAADVSTSLALDQSSVTENRPSDFLSDPQLQRLQSLPVGGDEVNRRDAAGWTALMQAAAAGNSQQTQLLLGKSADVNLKNNNGWTALMLAAYYGHVGIVDALLARGADVNARTYRNTTPLIAAAGQGHTEIVEMLLAHNAYPNARDAWGKSALDYAQEKGFVTIAMTLRRSQAVDSGR
jgi:uncharacterized protein